MIYKNLAMIESEIKKSLKEKGPEFFQRPLTDKEILSINNLRITYFEGNFDFQYKEISKEFSDLLEKIVLKKLPLLLAGGLLKDDS